VSDNRLCLSEVSRHTECGFPALRQFVHACRKRVLLKIRECCFFISGGGTFGTAAITGLLYQPRVIGNGDCGEIGEIKIGSPSATLSTTNPT
jgi:hypothetical protein